MQWTLHWGESYSGGSSHITMLIYSTAVISQLSITLITQSMLKRKIWFDCRDYCENGGILAHSPLQRCLRLAGIRVCTALHIISIRWRSRLWLGHCNSLILFFHSYSDKDLLSCICNLPPPQLQLSCYVWYNKRTFCVLSPLCSVHRFAAALYCDLYADKLKDNISVKALIACSLQ